jgi:hypothetical protein
LVFGDGSFDKLRIGANRRYIKNKLRFH